MAAKWQRRSLREVGVTLIDCDHRTPPAADDGYPYIAIPQLKEGRIDFTTARRISPANFADWTRKAKPQHHDVVLSRRCNPGETAYVRDGVEFALGQNLVLLRADGTELFPPFLRWLVRSPDWWEQVNTFINVGAVFDSLKCADIPNFKMPIPPLEEQKAIAKILSSLDDKIELNRRMNATLEAMARALFKAWFVDFEPVYANLENRPSTSASPEIAKLFPSNFENGIPVGWEEKPVGELLRYTIGGDWGTDEETEKNGDQVCIVRGTDIPNLKAGNFDTAPVRFVQSSKLEKRELFDGDIVIEVSGGSRDQATGRSLYFTDKLLENFRHKVVPASFCRLFRGINAEASLLLGVYLQVLYDEGGTWEYQTQSTGISNFQTTHFLSSARILIPNDPQVLREFYNIMRPMIEKQQSDESARLREIRDYLLPRLISGKIRVGDNKDETLEEIG